MLKKTLAAALVVTSSVSLAGAEHSGHGAAHGAQGHAPIGVMGDHLHKKGEWMLSYRYMAMAMDGNLDGNDELTTTEVHGHSTGPYMVAPEEMSMQMHMLGGMYAFSDKITAMLMLPYITNSMRHHRMVQDDYFTTGADGIGDVKLGALIGLQDTGALKSHLNVTVSLPTGDIDAEDRLPNGMTAQLPYPMQLGSGSYGIKLGATTTRYWAKTSLGAQGSYTHYLDKNDNDYKLGDKFQATTWFAGKIASDMSASIRLDYRQWNDIDGDSPAPMLMAPTMDPDLRAGKRLDAGLGINVQAGGNNRLALEILAPLWQDLDGPQLETSLQFTLGWQKAFDAK